MWAFSNILWTLVLLIVPFSALFPLIKGIISEKYILSLGEIVLLAVFIVLEVLVISGICISKFISLNTSINSEQLDKDTDEITPDFRFQLISSELCFKDRKNISNTINYKMTVLRDCVSKLERDVIWTGESYLGTKIISESGDFRIEDTDRKRSPYPYTIFFDGEKSIGEFIRVETETLVRDDNLEMMPRCSFLAKYQIDKLVIKVIAPSGMIKEVRKSIYADRAMGVCVMPPQPLKGEKIGDNISYTYEIENPNLLYNYFIEWEFTK